uniref:Uncharacterized protein n=1 Tax=viral metagenome TaxID=1070528 RepID=A0A2V0RC75_9ZZZZ
MKILPVVKKPVYPNTTLNSLLSAKRLAVQRDGDQLRLDFRSAADVANPNLDAAPRGSFNPAYTEVASLFELDPTAVLSTARSAVEIRNPVARVGTTSAHREMMYKTAWSAMVGQWWRDFNILYRMAKDAETRRDSVTTDKRLHPNLDVEDTDGFVEMFLSAVGDIDDSLMRYPIDKAISVDAVYAQVVSRMIPLVETLDHYGFQKGFDTYANVAGEGSLPGAVGERLFTLPARTFDGLGRAPWRALLRNPRARELARSAIVSRFEAALAAADTAQYSALDDSLDMENSRFCVLGEGDDMLVLPIRTTLPANQGSADVRLLHTGPYYTSGNEMFDAIVAEIDGLDPLTTASYQETSAQAGLSETYSLGGGWWWHHQFYNMGDLVMGLFDGTIDSAVPSLLCVRIRDVDTGNDGINNTAVVEADVVDTGPLWTVNYFDVECVNIVSGSTNVVANVEWTAPIDGVTDISLPNGILNIGSPADITAVQLIRLLNLLRDMWSPDHESLMVMTNRRRKVLPKASSVSLKGASTALGDMILQSQVRGTRLPLSPSFNRSRLELPGNHGCFTYPITQRVEPTVYPSSRDWGARDATTAVDLSLQGVPYGIEVAPSRITGQMSTGKAGGWLPGGIPGTRNAQTVTTDLMAMPLLENASTQMYNNGLLFGESTRVIGIGNPAGQDNEWIHSALPNMQNPGMYTHNVENMHHVMDYLPGYFSIGGEGNSLGPLNPTPRMWDLSRRDLSGNQIIDGVQHTAFVNGLIRLKSLSESDHTIIDATSGVNAYVYGDDFSEFPHHEGWFWDPGYTQVVGNSCHRLCGLTLGGASWLHPFVLGPISVFASYVPLSDLSGTVDWEDRQGRVLALTANSTIDASIPERVALTTRMTGLGITQMGSLLPTPGFGIGGSNLETGYGHAACVVPMNSPEIMLSKMDNETAVMQNEAVVDGYAGNVPGNRITHLSIFDAPWAFYHQPIMHHIHSLPNSNCRNPLLKFGGYAIMKSEGSEKAMVQTPVHSFGWNTVLPNSTEYSLWQGENLMPGCTAITHAQAQDRYDTQSLIACVITHDMNGLCGEFEDYSYMTSPTAWYVNKQAGIESQPGGSILGGQNTGYFAINQYNGKVIAAATEVGLDVGVPLLEADYIGLSAFGIGLPAPNRDTSPYPNSLSGDHWFSKRLDQTGNFNVELVYRALMSKRKKIYENPWSDKDASQDRLFESIYDSSEISSIVEAIRRAHASEGAKMTEGLVSEAFLRLQIVN